MGTGQSETPPPNTSHTARVDPPRRADPPMLDDDRQQMAFQRLVVKEKALKELGFYPYDPHVAIASSETQRVTDPEAIRAFAIGCELDAHIDPSTITHVKVIARAYRDLPKDEPARVMEFFAGNRKVATSTLLPRYQKTGKDMFEELGYRSELILDNYYKTVETSRPAGGAGQSSTRELTCGPGFTIRRVATNTQGITKTETFTPADVFEEKSRGR